MQKIIINNFGPIKNAEIEIKDMLILIGEQASGKSTIAKLIYFFKSLGDDFFNNFYKTDRNNYDVTEDIKLPIRTKFYDFFGSTLHLPDFEIKFYYSEDRYLELKLGRDKRLVTTFSKSFFSYEFQTAINNSKTKIREIETKIREKVEIREKIVLEQDKISAIQSMSQLIDDLFANKHSSSSFAIAGRETTVSYEATFEAYLEISLSNILEENRKKVMRAKEQTIDESLMISFLQEVRRIKGVFNKYGGSFADVIRSLSENDKIAVALIDRINLILKGEYKSDQWGEKLIFPNGQYVFLKDASSGQKEAIRILQDLVLCILEKQNALRVIEEPEAHLFPVAQKQLVELLAYMKNSNTKNQLIITTHSPYILTALNNLLFASRVVNTNPAHLADVEQCIPAYFHINPNDFSAYSLGNSLIGESEYWEDIFSTKTGTIKQNYLDTVSDLLGHDFNYLYALHSKSFKK
jgi:ABC-type dipeptide/oligopeptide/nickel transport system ATPase component